MDIYSICRNNYRWFCCWYNTITLKNKEKNYNGIITNIDSNSIVFENKLDNKIYSIDVNSSLNF